jgi:hypothetical protein
MLSKSKQGIFVLVLFLTASLACHSPRLVDDIQEVDLVGIWEAHYADADGIDTLTLRADGTYQQVYKDANGYVYKSSWNKWYLEHLPDERLRVHLKECDIIHTAWLSLKAKNLCICLMNQTQGH